MLLIFCVLRKYKRLNKMNQKLINKPIITSEDLEQLGIPPTQAKRVVHDAKKRAVSAGFTFYNGKQNFAPFKFICEIIGIGEVA
ncbi:DUF3173 family protein [Lactococcus lactis]|nr:DUF3173 family protein [Lactococcus lactis]